jgi:hypothetical protein
MRFAAAICAVLLLTGCAELRDPMTLFGHGADKPAAAPTPATPQPKPEAKPRARVERQAAPAPAAAKPAPAPADATAEPPIDYAARCRAMADNRAGDAKGLGASPAEQATMRDETYRDCMQQSVK